MPKLKLLLISIGLISSLTVVSQEFGLYTMSGKATCTDNWNLHLDEDGFYLIFFSTQESDDVVYNALISSGKFTSMNNKIILNDFSNNYNIVLKTNKDSLEVVKGFIFMNCKTFNYFNYDKMNSIMVDSNRSYNNLIKEIEEYRKHQSKTFSIKKGKYSSRRLSLVFSENNKYQLSFKKFCLSKGVYREELGLIILEDPILESTFYLIKKDNYLLSKFLPGDYYDDVLTFDKE